MHDYVKEILSTRYDDNTIRANELNQLVRSNSLEHGVYFEKSMELRRDIVRLDELLESDEEAGELAVIAKETLKEKKCKKTSEIEKFEKLMKVSKELREEYMYELYSIVEENQEIEEVLSMLCEDKKIKEPLINEFGDSAGSLNKFA